MIHGTDYAVLELIPPKRPCNRRQFVFFARVCCWKQVSTAARRFSGGSSRAAGPLLEWVRDILICISEVGCPMSLEFYHRSLARTLACHHRKAAIPLQLFCGQLFVFLGIEIALSAWCLQTGGFGRAFSQPPQRIYDSWGDDFPLTLQNHSCIAGAVRLSDARSAAPQYPGCNLNGARLLISTIGWENHRTRLSARRVVGRPASIRRLKREERAARGENPAQAASRCPLRG